MAATVAGTMARRPMREPMTVVDFPDQLRNDIFYCQRALKEHIKIHQVKINLLLKNQFETLSLVTHSSIQLTNHDPLSTCVPSVLCGPTCDEARK